MKEIIEYIKSFDKAISILGVYKWCLENGKKEEMEKNQYLVIELIKEHNEYIKQKKLLFR